MALYNFAFKPEVEHDGKEAWAVTAPKEIREKLWDLLGDLPKVVEYTGGNPTRITNIHACAGYKVGDAYAVTVVMLYAATASFQSDWDLGKFWQLTMTEHMELLHQLITVPCDVDLSLEDMEKILRWVIPTFASDDFGKISLNYGFSTGYSQGRLQKGMEARSRLLFAPNNLAMSEETRKEYIKQADAFVSILQDNRELCVLINRQIELYKGQARKAIQSFKHAANSDASLSALYLIWLAHQVAVQTAIVEMKKASEQYDSAPAFAALDGLALITPAEPPKSEQKS